MTPPPTPWWDIFFQEQQHLKIWDQLHFEISCQQIQQTESLAIISSDWMFCFLFSTWNLPTHSYEQKFRMAPSDIAKWYWGTASFWQFVHGKEAPVLNAYGIKITYATILVFCTLDLKWVITNHDFKTIFWLTNLQKNMNKLKPCLQSNF